VHTEGVQTEPSLGTKLFFVAKTGMLNPHRFTLVSTTHTIGDKMRWLMNLFNWRRSDEVEYVWENDLTFRARFKECLFGLVIIWNALKGYAFMGWEEDEEEILEDARPPEPKEKVTIDDFYTKWLHARVNLKNDKDAN
jgi:hypothetical protein